MRNTVMTVVAAALVAAVTAGPAAASPLDATSPAARVTSEDTAVLQASAPPKSFRWVPFQGLPTGKACRIRANDTGGALVTVGSEWSADSVWLARAGGAFRLPLPTNVVPFMEPGSSAVSNSGVAAVAAWQSDWDPVAKATPHPHRLLRWTTAGGVESVVPSLPEGAAVNTPEVQVVGVTPEGHVVFTHVRTHKGVRFQVLAVWKMGGELRELGVFKHDLSGPSLTRMATDGSFVMQWTTEQATYSQVVRPLRGWDAVDVKWFAPGVDALSADGRWWVGSTYELVASPDSGFPEVVASFVAGKGLATPTQSLSWGWKGRSINNQGTVLAEYGSSHAHWVHGPHVVDVASSVTSLPPGATVDDDSVNNLDTAGRVMASIVRDGNCRAGVLAPQW